MHPLLDAFEVTAASRARRLAASDQSLALDYRSFRAVACGLAGHMTAATECERIGILAPTSTACAAAIFAAWYAGKTPIPLNFLLPHAELAKVVCDARIDCIASIDRFMPLVERAGLKFLPLSDQTLTPGDASIPGKSVTDTAVILYTSGTSGDPKGVCLSFSNIVGNATNCVAHARMNPDQVFLSVLPQFHSFGLTGLTVIPLLLGASVHYLPRFSPVAFINTIRDQQVSVVLAVASMFGALSHVKSADPAALRSLTLAISGGEPLPPTVFDAFKAKFGVEIMEGYGLTETSPVVAVNLPWAHRPGSVGLPLPDVQVKAVDANGRDLPSGTDGELYIRGHNVMQGYYNRPSETAAALRDGWFRTGDIGRIDADGFVYITGRAKEMMIIGGENVYPREIEAVLEQHPAVAEAAAIGVSDGIRGEVPVAFVILKDAETGDAVSAVTDSVLRDFCRDKIAGFKIPRRIHIAKDFPRSGTGKILKRALREPG